MSRPELRTDLSLDAIARKRRSKLTVGDIAHANGEEPQDAADAKGTDTAASSPAAKPEAARAPRKPRGPKKAAGAGKVMVSFRLPPDVRDELERVGQLHSQPASFVIRKLIDQWAARSQDKREEILKK